MNRRPTTQDISWFIDLHNNQQLDLNPPYQRRSVWTTKDRWFFLDTVFRDYPCPAIFLHKTIDENGKQTYHVVDGKQRLETIIRFVNNKISVSKTFGDATLDGKKWDQLKAAPELQTKFWDYVLTVEMVKTIEGTVLNSVFDRLNRNSRKLDRQELRHAKYDGWFITLAEAESEKEEWKRLKVVTTARAKRMKDVQFLSELMLVILDRKVVGFDQDYLDDKYAEYDSPNETHPSFSEEDFVDRLEAMKSTVLGMEDFNGCITNYAKTFGNFYTLWSALVLSHAEPLPNSDTLAPEYASFMARVEELMAQEHIDVFLETVDKAQYRDAQNYMRHSVGASTDLTQRDARVQALTNALSIT